MKIESKTIQNYVLQVLLRVEKAEFDEARRQAYLNSTDRYPVPGIAPGLAKLSDLEKTYGPAVLFDEALNTVIPGAFRECLERENLRIFGKPEISDMEFLPEGGVRFKVKADLFPEVELGQYLGIKVPYIRREQQAEFEQEVIRKACENMKGEIPPAMIEQRMNAIVARTKLDIQNDAVYHLLADMLVILDEAYAASGAARPKVQVRREAMDLMLQTASAEHETDWRPFMKDQIMVMAERYRSLPADFDKTVERIIENRTAAKQKMDPDKRTQELFNAYLGSLELTEEQWKNQRTGQAAREVCIDLLLDAVAVKEKIRVNSDEVHRAMEELADRYGITPEEAEANIDRDAFVGKMCRDKALALILNSAETDYAAKEALDRKREEAKAAMEEKVEIRKESGNA